MTQYTEIALEIILNDQAYRDAVVEYIRWQNRQNEACRKMQEINAKLCQYESRLKVLSQKIARIDVHV